MACTEFPSPEDGALPSAVPGMPGARNTIYKFCETKNLSKPFPRPQRANQSWGQGEGDAEPPETRGVEGHLQIVRDGPPVPDRGYQGAFQTERSS